MQVARKISVGSINGVRSGFKGTTEKTFVARIVGIASSAEAKESQFGTYWKFTGEFQATNMEGEIIGAPACMLPEPSAGMLAAAVKESNGGVQFGFDFFVVPDEKSTTGYVYQVHPLIESKPSNPLADLLQGVPELPKLAAPKSPDAAPAPAESPATAPADAPTTATAEEKPAVQAGKKK